MVFLYELGARRVTSPLAGRTEAHTACARTGEPPTVMCSSSETMAPGWQSTTTGEQQQQLLVEPHPCSLRCTFPLRCSAPAPAALLAAGSAAAAPAAAPAATPAPPCTLPLAAPRLSSPSSSELSSCCKLARARLHPTSSSSGCTSTKHLENRAGVGVGSEGCGVLLARAERQLKANFQRVFKHTI